MTYYNMASPTITFEVNLHSNAPNSNSINNTNEAHSSNTLTQESRCLKDTKRHQASLDKKQSTDSTIQIENY